MADDDSGHVDSPSQDDYVALADAVRARLKSMAEQGLAQYAPAEVKWYIDACQANYWFEVSDRTFDHKVQHGNQCWGE